MLIAEHCRAMARYNTWMNSRLYALAAELSDEERRRDLGAFFRSVHGTLNHLLLGDRAWLGRILGKEQGASLNAAGEVIEVRVLNQELYADFAILRRERARTDIMIEQWAYGLDAAELGRSFRYAMLDGTEYEHPLWWAASHLFNHQTHHRGQLTALFKQLGRDPGATDLMVMLRAERATQS